jgi:hypothetical protein
MSTVEVASSGASTSVRELTGKAVGPAEEHALRERRVRDELHVDVEDAALLVRGANVDAEGKVRDG